MTDSLPAPRARYRDVWRAVPGTLGYLFLALVISIAGLATTAGLFFAGVATAIIMIGIPLMSAALVAARGFAAADRGLVGLSRLPLVPDPEWDREATPRTGVVAGVTRPMRHAHYWMALLHTMIVSPIVAIAAFTIGISWTALALGGLTSWFWMGFIPDPDGAVWGGYVSDAVPWLFGGWSAEWVEGVLTLLAGVFFALTLPWVLRALAWLRWVTARGMIGRWRSDDLAAELRAEAQARGAAVHAEDVSLRRLERDIHDGPQQRLVRLQMDLASLERRATSGDGEGAAQLARESIAQAKAALDELRALSSGVAPPLLQDRGLAASLESISADAAIAVEARIDGDIDQAVTDEIARNAYFIVAELLTNVVKHGGASSAEVRAVLRGEGANRTLEIRVVDEGVGGATMQTGHGLAGLAERIAGLKGSFLLDSPPGGPTAVGAYIPVPDRSDADGIR
ncbi:sensor histidine kinase [Microbacterium sp. G2-8]|uniref:sensor histidine kinase n=1 Tax=Microbacterium sp. G2-8 TaxID=2842454 RepID=UPI001C89C427|nr:sensor histidine kinase [Microbacterium sp. G2-8]